MKQELLAEIDSQYVIQAKERAIEWFLSSGIQRSDHGGVYAWYDPEKKQYAFLYPEITGYAISVWLYLYQTEKRLLFLDQARAAANWILNHAWDVQSQSIPFRFYDDQPQGSPYSYTFDSGMILSGLVALASLTGEKRYQEGAAQMGHWICDTMIRSEGGLFCFWDLRQKIRLSSPDKWSTIPWAFLTKVARSLVELGQLTAEKRYLEIGESVAEWGSKSQLPQGQYPILPAQNWIVSHPFLYAVEGLFLCGELLRRSDFLESAQRGLKWLTQQRLESEGWIPAEIGTRREPYQVRSDVQAQFLRMALLLPESQISEEIILQILKGLLRFQNPSGSKEISGGFRFALDLEKRMIQHCNAWCTLFAIQALSLMEEWLQTGEVSEQRRKAAIHYFV